jgi:hypothetical protein
LYNFSEERHHLIPGKQTLIMALFFLLKRSTDSFNDFTSSKTPENNLAVAADVLQSSIDGMEYSTPPSGE